MIRSSVSFLPLYRPRELRLQLRQRPERIPMAVLRQLLQRRRHRRRRPKPNLGSQRLGQRLALDPQGGPLQEEVRPIPLGYLIARDAQPLALLDCRLERERMGNQQRPSCVAMLPDRRDEPFCRRDSVLARPAFPLRRRGGIGAGKSRDGRLGSWAGEVERDQCWTAKEPDLGGIVSVELDGLDHLGASSSFLTSLATSMMSASNVSLCCNMPA